MKQIFSDFISLLLGQPQEETHSWGLMIGVGVALLLVCLMLMVSGVR